MFSDALALALALMLSSAGLIFVLYYYILRIGSFNMELDIQRVKNKSVFRDGDDSQVHLNLLEKESAEGGALFLFIHIYESAEQLLKDFFSYQYKVTLFFGFFFLFITVFLLEEYIGSLYVTFAFLFGVLYSIFLHYFAAKFGRSAVGVGITQSLEGGYDAFRDTFQIAYNSGMTLIILFLSTFSILLTIMTACFSATYVDNSNFNEYQNMFVLLMGGFTLGYSFAAFFFRISGTLFSSSMGTAADLVSKSDYEVKSDDFFNPCSIPNSLALFSRNYLSNFSDLTTIFMLLATVLLISISGSQEFTQNKASFYFVEMFFGFMIIGALFSAIWIRFSFFSKNDLVNWSSKNYRLQLVLNHLFSLAANTLIILLSFPNGFSYSLEDDKTIAGKITTYEKRDVSIGYIWVCFLTGYLAEIILLITSEYFTSHIYKPVRSLLDKTENGPCLNLFMAMILGMITFTIPMMCFLLCFIIAYGTLGYFGLAICATGLLGTVIPLFAINCVASWAEQGLRFIKMSRLLVEEELRSNPLFTINWSSQNFYMHVRIVIFGTFVLSGFSFVGCYAHRTEGYLEILQLKTLQITGFFYGSMLPFLIGGVLLALIQRIVGFTFALAKKQFTYFPGIKSGVDKPDYSNIFSEARFKSHASMFSLFVFNFLVVYFFGLLMGIESVLGMLIAMILTSSFLIYSSFMGGTLLSNSKNFADHNNSVEKYGPIAASVSIGEMFSLLTKEALPSLMIIFVFDFIVCLLSQKMVDKTSWVASGVGLI